MASVDKIGAFLGPYGKWQLRSTILICLVKIPSAWFMACLIFTAKSPKPGEIFCKPPFSIPVSSVDSWTKAAHDEKYSSIENEETFDFCKIHSDAVEVYLNQTASNQLKNVQCLEFEISKPSYVSIILQFELFCSRDVLVTISQSFHLLGVLLGGIVAFYMLKSVSPRQTILIGYISQIVFGLATGYAPTYLLHIIFRAAVAGTCSLMCIGISILADITSVKYRVITCCLFEQFWAIGVILLPLMSTFWSSWNLVYVAITLPTLSLMLTYYWIPDSPQWLLKHERIDEAAKIMIEAARVNKKTNFNKEDLINDLIELSTEMKKAPPEPSIFSIWDGNTQQNLTVFAAHAGWSIYLSLYFASLLHVRAMGRNYLEVNTVIAGLAEIVGNFIAMYLILNTTKKWMWTSLLNIATSFIQYSALLIPLSATPFQRMMILMATTTVAKITISTTLSMFIACMSEIVSDKSKKKACNYSGVTCSRTLVIIGGPFIGFSASMHGNAMVPQCVMALINLMASLMIASCIDTPRTLSLKKKDDENECTQL